jgi:hypothetical protein
VGGGGVVISGPSLLREEFPLITASRHLKMTNFHDRLLNDKSIYLVDTAQRFISKGPSCSSKTVREMEALSRKYRLRAMHLKSTNFHDRLLDEKSIHVQNDKLNFHVEGCASRMIE